MLKTLVTGGSGFIGFHVVDLFVAQGYDFVVVGNLSTRGISNLKPSAMWIISRLRRE